MSYYRAALASAYLGNLTSAVRLVQCSILVKENAPSAVYFLKLLKSQDEIDTKTTRQLLALIKQRNYKKALKVNLPQTSKAYTIRGLLYAQMGRRKNATQALSMALTLNTGNKLAKQTLKAVLRRVKK